MNSLFRPDIKITDYFKSHRFTVSAEVIPPRNGAEQIQVIGQIQQLVEAGSQFLSVTKGAGGSLRGGSLPIAQAIKESLKVPCIAHFTVRDLTLHDVENQLMDHHYFGIRNVLALRGDPPDGQPNWQAKDGGHSYAYQLMEQIRDLNQGKYLGREGGPTPTSQLATDFCIGAAVYPEFPDLNLQLEYFERKLQAGAEYAITDMLFDPESYARFRDRAARLSRTIPILPGTRLLKSRTQAERMMKKFKVSVPSEILNRLPEKDSDMSLDLSLELLDHLCKKLHSYGAPGIHLFVIVDTPIAVPAIEQLRKTWT
jgi:methylenetetrahydrofolate reductase (NADPH)